MAMNESDLLDELIDAVVLDQAKARRIIQAHPGVLNARRSLGETALHHLAIENFPEGVRFLAQAGADVNTKNESDNTPLIDATILGNTEVVCILLLFGADPNIASVINDNALHNAICSGNSEIVDALLQAGADPNYCTSIGDTVFTALSEAKTQREAILAILTKYGIKEE